MPVPIRYDDAVTLCGGTQGQPIREMLLNKFYQVQTARIGSYADRERAFLISQGGTAGDSRYDLWRAYFNNTRPFTDGVPAALDALDAQDFLQTVPGIPRAGAEVAARVWPALNQRGTAAGSVVAGGSYSYTAA